MYANMSDIDLDSLEEMIGVDCYEAAAGYVRRQAVLKVLWAAERNELPLVKRRTKEQVAADLPARRTCSANDRRFSG